MIDQTPDAGVPRDGGVDSGSPPGFTEPGDIDIQDSLEFTALRALLDEGLVEIEGDLTIRFVAQPIDLAGLEIVGGTLSISDSSSSALLMPDLRSIGALGTARLPNVAEVELGRLETCPGGFRLNDLGEVLEISLDSLSNAPNPGFFDNANLGQLSLPLLQDATNVSVVANPELVQLSLDGLRTAEILNVINNARLEDLVAPSLVGVSNIFNVSGNTALPQCAVDGLLQQLSTAPSEVTTTENNGEALCD